MHQYEHTGETYSLGKIYTSYAKKKQLPKYINLDTVVTCLVILKVEKFTKY